MNIPLDAKKSYFVMESLKNNVLFLKMFDFLLLRVLTFFLYISYNI